MKRYAKIVDDSLVFPQDSEFAGIPNWKTNDSALRRRGYLPVEGDAVQREGYVASPSSWYVVNQSVQVVERRQVKVDVTDGDGNKTEEGYEMQDVPVVKDLSYIQVESWNYRHAPPQSYSIDEAQFKVACKMFRDVCAQIGEFIGDDGFRGGFEEYGKFINSSSAKSSKASASLLASMWSGANEYAKYEASKIGMGAPEWWYKCWSYTDEELQEASSSSEG